MFYLIF